MPLAFSFSSFCPLHCALNAMLNCMSPLFSHYISQWMRSHCTMLMLLSAQYPGHARKHYVEAWHARSVCTKPRCDVVALEWCWVCASKQTQQLTTVPSKPGSVASISRVNMHRVGILRCFLVQSFGIDMPSHTLFQPLPFSENEKRKKKKTQSR